MRRKRTNEQLAERRVHGLALLAEGKTPKEVAEILEVTKRLEKALDKGAYAFGYAGDYWTLDRTAQVLWQLFGVRYETSAVWHVMQRMGWSNQRPQRRPLHRNEEAIEQWKKEELPRIKKVSPVGRYPRSGG